MLNTQDRGRLMRQMQDQAPVDAAIVARCAAGLCVVGLIAAIGAATADGGAADAPREARVPAAQTIARRADAHRREIFEQRRQRYAGNDLSAAQSETVPGMVSAASK